MTYNFCCWILIKNENMFLIFLRAFKNAIVILTWLAGRVLVRVLSLSLTRLVMVSQWLLAAGWRRHGSSFARLPDQNYRRWFIFTIPYWTQVLLNLVGCLWHRMRKYVVKFGSFSIISCSLLFWQNLHCIPWCTKNDYTYTKKKPGQPKIIAESWFWAPVGSF